MTVFELLYNLAGTTQDIAIYDYSAGAEPETVYEGVTMYCPYCDDKNRQNPYSLARVDGIEAKDNRLIIDIGVFK